MNRATMAVVALTLLGGAACRGGGAPPSVQAKTEDEKVIYALGAVLGQQAVPLKLTPAELEMLKQGVADAAAGAKLQAEPAAYRSQFQKLLAKRAAADTGQEKLRGLAFQTQAAQEAGATKAESGLIYKTLKPGTGKSPTTNDIVKAHYKGTLVSGKVFDSSYDRGQPLEFALDGVIPCWTEGIQRMKVGETAKLVCPPEIAYGDNGSPPVIPGGSTLVFEVQLIGFTPKPKK